MTLNDLKSNINTKNMSFLAISLCLMGILSIMIFPLPEFMLDVLIACNICFSLVILFTAISTKNPLDFSILPTILLVTTLLRLSLNIASTKAILGNGAAGKLITAFGNFVVQGNPFVGFLVFIIIIIVQFMVITKGSERISEVSARFKLDAMPLKMMAVEGELNQGLINEQEATKRRKAIQAEADFFGSMDGASKFIKGDSVAGLIITVINVLVGFAVGMMSQGLTFQESLYKYTLLTVGDGLLSIIPSLLISVATAIIVTRPYEGEDMGNEFISQLSSMPQVFYISSLICAVLLIIPGTNKLVFIGMSGALAGVGYLIQSNLKNKESFVEAPIVEDNELLKEINYVEKYNTVPLTIEVGVGLIHLVNKEEGGQLIAKLEMIRERTLNTLGFLIPPIKTVDNINLQPYEYRILLNGLPIGTYELRIGKLLAISPAQENIDLEGIDTVEPAYQYRAKWIEKNLAKLAEVKGYTIVDNIDIITSHLENVATKYSHEILTREMVKEIIGYVKEKNPTVVEEVIPNLLTLGQVQTVLENLLREGVSIKNLNLILEALADSAHLDKDPAILTDLVRLKLKKQIIDSLDQGEDIYYIGFTYDSEELLTKHIVQTSLYTNFLALPPLTAESFMNQLEHYAEAAITAGKIPVILCSTKVRFYLAKYMEPKLPFIKVISHEEINIPDIKIHHLGDMKLTT